MSKFNVGDKVRMKRTVCIDYATFPRGTEGRVTRNDDAGLFVSMVNAEDGKMVDWWCLDSNIELVAPADPKRDFLERLQKLMREFNAEIYWYDGLGIKIGSIYVPYNGYAITADNIMDFDKE